MKNMRLGALIVALMFVSTQVVLPVPADDGQQKQHKKAGKNGQKSKSKEGKSKVSKPKEDRAKQKLKVLLASPNINDSAWRTDVEGYLSQLQQRRPDVAARFQQQYNDILAGKTPTAASRARTTSDDSDDSDQ